MSNKILRLDMPATYQIRVQGCLPDSWSNRLGGMTVITPRQAEEVSETILTGQLPDQSALLGVLNTLYDLHLPLLSVDCQSCE